MANNSSLTLAFRADCLRQFVTDVIDHSYYFFYSKYTPWDDDTSPPSVSLGQYGSFYGPWSELFYGKKVRPEDIAYVFKRTNWTLGTVYDVYDDRLTNPDEANFYVVTDERKVYKCLSNARGAPSTSKPTSTVTTPFTLGDGYTWKYMFTVSEFQQTKHASTDRYPVMANTIVEGAAVNGSIEVVLLDVSGNNWIAHHTGTVTQVQNSTLLRISSDAATVNGIYAESSFFVSSGDGAGGLATITNYVSNGAGNFVMISPELPNTAFGDGYVISPRVHLTGDGTGFKAYSIVNTATAEVDRIVVLNPGQDYSTAEAKLIAANGVGNDTHSSIHAVISPPGGHGSDPVGELYCYAVSLWSHVSNTASVPASADFRTVGLLRDPIAANGQIMTAAEFNAFTNLELSFFSGSLVDDEVIENQDGSTGTVFFQNSTHAYVVGMSGQFAVSDSITGQTSGATATITAINTPEVRVNTGRILHVTHVSPVVRSAVSSENLKLTVKF